MPGLAVACDAAITIVGVAGERVIEAADFFLGPLTTALAAGRNHHRNPTAAMAGAAALGF